MSNFTARARRGVRRPARLALACALAAPLGCSGTVSTDAPDDAPSGGAGPTDPGGRSPSGGKNEKPGTGGQTPGAPPVSAPGAVDPGPAPLRRLTNGEYLATVRDLLGTDAATLGKIRLVEDKLPEGAFDTNAEVQSLSPEHLGAYGDAAALLAAEALGTPARRTAVLGCEPAADGACLRRFIERFGRRAYRGPLSTKQIDAYVALARGEPTPVEGAQLVLRAMLQAPSFLFRAEIGVEAPERPGLRRLTGLEAATRLSYLLAGTTPSEALLDSAARGELDTAAGVEKAALALLADPRAKAPVRAFLRTWLGAEAVGHVSRTAKKFPAWNDALRAAMQEETTRFAEDLFWGDGKTPRDFRDFVSARHTFVNAPLAKIYGLPQPAGNEWQRAVLPDSLPRAGLLTQPGILALTGREDGSSAIWRGKFVRQALLCGELPPPPANVPTLERIDPNLSERDRLEQHRKDPACSGCHHLLDPIGFGLSRYDAIGAYQPMDAAGRAIPEDGNLDGPANGGAFRGAVELATKLRAAPETAACAVEQLATFALGRSPKESDRPLTAELAAAYGRTGSLRDAVAALVRSDAFRYRRP
jgi:hypothetical protein